MTESFTEHGIYLTLSPKSIINEAIWSMCNYGLAANIGLLLPPPLSKTMNASKDICISCTHMCTYTHMHAANSHNDVQLTVMSAVCPQVSLPSHL